MDSGSTLTLVESAKIEASSRIRESDILRLKRWNTPTIYNGWEQITNHDIAREAINLEALTDYMPEMGPMVGRAITVVFEPSNPEHPKRNPNNWSEYREYVASVEGPKIVVVQDLDKPEVVGAFWGEVNSGLHRALGCVGTIIDGAIRDLDEMKSVGFKALARQMVVSHAHSIPVRWGCEVEVFGQKVSPGRLIHADKHGFIVIPPEDEAKLLDATLFMDGNECDTLIAAARACTGLSAAETLEKINAAAAEFTRNVKAKFGRRGEF